MSAPVLIVGGAGFVGSNLAAHLARNGQRVRIYDDLSRPGVDRNLAWLQKSYGPRVESVIADVRDRERLRTAVTGTQAVFHLAAQCAVATSMVEPIHDFDVNARGTIEVLEAARKQKSPPAVIVTSTSQVYGCLPDLPMQLEEDRWRPADERVARVGIDETRPLEPCAPNACSKACADQYALDYARSFGIPALVFRVGCTYGPRQLGDEEEDWVAHFLSRAIENKSIAIYGDGRQVRDLLYIDDLVDAFVRAWSRIGAIAGRAFNVGGGPEHTLSPLELLSMIESLRGAPPTTVYADWRPGEQRYYVSNTSSFSAETGWRPRVGPRAGIEALHGWLVENRGRHV